MFQLPNTSSPDERKAALLAFLSSWHGELNPPQAWQAPAGCPALLSWWHSLTLSNPILTGAQNDFYSPEPVTLDPFVKRDGEAIIAEGAHTLWFFYSENQGVQTWAAESGDDPIVWVKSDSWSKEKERLSGFLMAAILMEAMYGAEYGGVWTQMALSDFESIEGLKKISLQASTGSDAPIEFWRSADFIAASTRGTDPGEIRVLFGSTTPGVFEEIGELVDDPYHANLWQ